MSPDTLSSLFPDRPIRPLPKRKLRERLSPDAFDSLKYPPSPQDSAPLFYYPPYTIRGEATPPSVDSQSSLTMEPDRQIDSDRPRTARRTRVSTGDVNEEHGGERSAAVTRSPPEILTRPRSDTPRPDFKGPDDLKPPHSTTSSLDGYDSFENTNNKKKRKIPSAGDSILSSPHNTHHVLSSFIATGDVNSEGGYSASGTFVPASHGISGSGRGRLGTLRNGRGPPPLKTMPDTANTANTWAPQPPKPPEPDWSKIIQPGDGIITSAIANAGRLPALGRGNMSLLQELHMPQRPHPGSTQFTFTCDSQVPGTVPWPGQPGRQTMGAQAAPQPGPGASGGDHVGGDGHAKNPAGAPGSPGASRRKSRRRFERELNMGARHRRDIAGARYFHNPPKPEDVWICEFCEYERIFGVPPRALIRNYEIKDRRLRQEEADRKRLLEKAKAKSRKSKKSGKAAARGTASNNSPGQAPIDTLVEGEVAPMQPSQSYSTQSEEDEYEYEYEEVCSPTPAYTSHHGDVGILDPGDDGGGGESAKEATQAAKS